MKVVCAKQYNDEAFLLKLEKIDGAYYAWVYIIGVDGRYKAKDFICELTVEKLTLKRAVTCPVVPIEHEKNRVIEQGNFMRLTKSNIERFKIVDDNEMEENRTAS